MSLKCTFLFLLFFSAVVAAAQDCTRELVATMNGKWTEGMKGSARGLTSSEMEKEKAIVGEVHKMLQRNYKPVAVDADYNSVYDGYKSEYRYPNIYGYTIRFMPYICEGKNIGKAHETNTTLNIYANQIALGPEIYEPFVDATAWDEGFRWMSKLPELINGVFSYEEKVSLGFGNSGPQYTWIITPGNQLPFTFITRKEFLEKKRQKLTLGRKEEEERLRSAATETKKKILGSFDAAINKVETELKKPAEELSLTAIVKQDPNDYLSHLFTSDKDPFARILIKPNPAYFNTKLPKTTPQFFSVVLKGDPKNPAMQKVISDIQKAIDFNFLKSLLKK